MTGPSHLAPRLAVVISHPTQYHSPWFRWLHASGGWTLRVFYLWDAGIRATLDSQFETTFAWDVDLISGYESEFVPNIARAPGADHWGGFRNPELIPRLAAWKPDAVLIFGYTFSSHFSVIRWAWRTGVPLIFRGDSHYLGRSAASGLKGMALRWLFRRFAAVTFVGAANRDYFRALGVAESRLFFAPHCVDDRHFDPESVRHRVESAALKERLGLAAETTVVLFAGKLVPAKQPRALLEAFLALDPENAALVFVGSGAEREALAARVRAAQTQRPKVHFLPFANQSEMPARYLLADVFALPSRGHYETWGLAVNEAMHMRVPCLVSDRVGCQRDLVTDGETGWVFNADDASSLQAALARALAEAKPQHQALGRAVRARIAGYTYAHAAAGLRRALSTALSHPSCD